MPAPAFESFVTMIAGFWVRCGLVMLRSAFVVFRSFAVVLGGVFRHERIVAAPWTLSEGEVAGDEANSRQAFAARASGP
jgi:hypothetical protein